MSNTNFKGAPLGNQNAAKGRAWRDAINRALAKRSRVDAKEALDELAEKFLATCDEGEVSAFRELGDRLDGKAPQAITGPDDGPVEITVIKRLIVRE